MSCFAAFSKLVLGLIHFQPPLLIIHAEGKCSKSTTGSLKINPAVYIRSLIPNVTVLAVSTVNKRTKYTLFFPFFATYETCHKSRILLNNYQVSCFEPKDGNVFTKLLPYFFPARSGKNLEVIPLYCYI